MKPRLNPYQLAPELLVAINGWNHIAISFRSLHPVKAG